MSDAAGVIPVTEWRPRQGARPGQGADMYAGLATAGRPLVTAEPGYDEIVLTAPGSPRPCNSRACARAGKLAEVIVTYGVLSDPGAGYHAGGALWRESWGRPVPMCAACWDSSRQVAVKYRPSLVVTDNTGTAAAPQTSGGRA